MANLRLKEILKSNKGASLILVLCVTALLLGISGSLLFAASSASGSNSSKTQYDQIIVFNDSLMRTVTYNICGKENISLDKTLNTLGGNIFYEVGNHYNRGYNNNPSKIPDYPDGDLDVSSLPTDMMPKNLTIEYLKMSVTELHANVTPYKPAEPAVTDESGKVISPGSPREPQKVDDISFSLKITLKTSYKQQVLTTVATYKFTGGRLVDKGSDGDHKNSFEIVNSGKWRMLSYEREEN